MTLHEIIFSYFWIPPIVGIFIQCFTMHRKSREYIIDNPNLSIGYRNYITNYAIYSLIPWGIIGVGILTKSIESITDLFQLQSANPYVYAFFGVFIFTAIIKSFWIFFLNGANFFEKHPGLFQDGKGGEITAKQIKRRQLINLASSIVGLIIVLYFLSKADLSPLTF